MAKTRKIRKFAVMLLLQFLFLFGCGQEEHAPVVKCINIGIDNVRRNLRIKVSLNVDRQPLSGVSSSTVQLLKLPEQTSIPGEVYYLGERLVFYPSSPLADSTKYRFQITDGIQDASGKELTPMHQDFTTGSVLQVYHIELLRDYDAGGGQINSIAIYFSEGVDSTTLALNTSVDEDDWLPQTFDIVYYDDIALAVLLFTYPLQVDRNYTLRLSSAIMSASDAGQLDGDRDGTDVDNDPYTLNFRYASDLVEGITISDSSSNAAEYYEPIERCFLSEFE